MSDSNETNSGTRFDDPKVIDIVPLLKNKDPFEEGLNDFKDEFYLSKTADMATDELAGMLLAHYGFNVDLFW